MGRRIESYLPQQTSVLLCRFCPCKGWFAAQALHTLLVLSQVKILTRWKHSTDTSTLRHRHRHRHTDTDADADADTDADADADRHRNRHRHRHRHRHRQKRKDYAFRCQFNEKPSIIPGCPFTDTDTDTATATATATDTATDTDTDTDTDRDKKAIKSLVERLLFSLPCGTRRFRWPEGPAALWLR